MLAVSHVSRSFSGIRALADASLDVRAGEIHALVGENGAGKSTLVRILTGALEPDGGTVAFDGHRITTYAPLEARRLGLLAIDQHPALFPDLSVAENLAIGVETLRPWSQVDWPARRRRAQALLDLVGARIDVDREAASLSLPEQQLVEIARALGANARLLILDEPTVGLERARGRIRTERGLAGAVLSDERVDLAGAHVGSEASASARMPEKLRETWETASTGRPGVALVGQLADPDVPEAHRVVVVLQRGQRHLLPRALRSREACRAGMSRPSR